MHRPLARIALACTLVSTIAAPAAGQGERGRDELALAEAALARCREAAEAGDEARAIPAADEAERLLEEARPKDTFQTARLPTRIAQVKIFCRIGFAEMMEQARLFAESEELLSRALEIEPGYREARLTLATILYHAPPFLGRTGDAIREYERLLEDEVESGVEVYLHLGELYRRQERMEEAREILRRGLERFPDSDPLKDAIEAAKSLRDPPRETATLTEAIDAIVRRAAAQPEVPGISAVVRSGGETVQAAGHGLADVESDAPATAETVYRLGSVSKQFTAAAALLLVGAERLSLEDTVGEWFPGPATAARSITVHQLLSHTGGLPSDVPAGPEGEIGSEAWVERVLAGSLEAEPGEVFLYSNVGYTLLGRIVERASGEPFGAFLEERVFAPAGMEATRLCDERRIVPGRAEGYAWAGDRLVNDLPVDWSRVRFVGGVCSTVLDLARWHEALFDGEILAARLVERMISPVRLAGGELAPYGYGLALRERLGRPAVHHNGGINGFTAQVAYYPGEELFVAVLANSEAAAPWDVERDLAARILEEGG